MGRKGRAATMAAVFAAPVVLAAAGVAFLPLFAAAIIPVAAVVAAFIVVGKVVDPKGRGAGLAAACVICSVLAVLVGAPLLVLRVRGERTRATVTAVETGYTRSGKRYEYSLVAADGRRIPGKLSEPDDEYAVGDRVDVFYDPSGIAAPNDVGFVRLGVPLGALAAGLLLAGAALCIPATRARPDPTGAP